MLWLKMSMLRTRSSHTTMSRAKREIKFVCVYMKKQVMKALTMTSLMSFFVSMI